MSRDMADQSFGQSLGEDALEEQAGLNAIVAADCSVSDRSVYPRRFAAQEKVKMTMNRLVRGVAFSSIYLFMVISLFSSFSIAQFLPANASPSVFGEGWVCNKGYYKAGGECLKVQVPQNASLDYYGHGWVCNKGYYKAGGECLKVQVPQNASLDYYGHGWVCNKGYYKAGGECLKVQVPQNASLDYYGHGWVCNKGYYKAGGECLKVQVPQNASLDYYGHGWVCNKGYKEANNSCVPMSQSELQQQKELDQALLTELQRLKDQIVSGDDCDREYKTNAEVCVELTRTDLDCNESFTGNYYRYCDVTIRYNIKTDYQGNSSIAADVECEVEIDYEGKDFYSTRSDSDDSNETHNLYAYDSDSDAMAFNFSFGYHEEVTRVNVASARCSIDNLYLY